jgi:hypothetical protein
LTARKIGSFYHSHVDFQPLTAYGAFIVEDAIKPPVHYDHDLVVLLGDIYHLSDDQLEAKLLNKTFSWIGEPQALTINGDAVGTCNSTSSQCTTTCKQHVFEVDPGKTYRVRTIGASALTFPYFAIEGHPSLTVIAADAQYITPVNTSFIAANSGQRFDFLLKTMTESQLSRSGGKRAFWGRVETRWRPVRDPGSFLLSYRRGTGKGKRKNNDVLKLASGLAPVNLNTTVYLPGEINSWINGQIKPFVGASVENDFFPSGKPARAITLDAAQLTWDGKTVNWFVDGAIVSPCGVRSRAGRVPQLKHYADNLCSTATKSPMYHSWCKPTSLLTPTNPITRWQR